MECSRSTKVRPSTPLTRSPNNGRAGCQVAGHRSRMDRFSASGEDRRASRYAFAHGRDDPIASVTWPTPRAIHVARRLFDGRSDRTADTVKRMPPFAKLSGLVADRQCIADSGALDVRKRIGTVEGRSRACNLERLLGFRRKRILLPQGRLPETSPSRSNSPVCAATPACRRAWAADACCASGNRD